MRLACALVAFGPIALAVLFTIVEIRRLIRVHRAQKAA